MYDSKEKIERRFEYLSKLKHGWGSYTAIPILPESITMAREALGILKTECHGIVPCENGGIQLEWHFTGFDIEITIHPKEDIDLSIFLRNSYFHDSVDVIKNLLHKHNSVLHDLINTALNKQEPIPEAPGVSDE